MRRLVPLTVAALAFAACQDASGPNSELVRVAPQVSAARNAPIPGDYIITFRDDVGDVAAAAQSIAGLHKGALKHVYKSALKGFAVQNISEATAAAIASDPRVVRVEADQVMTAIGSPQTPATWGLDRVDQSDLPLNNTYAYNNDGSNVTVYIIDTGINFTHVDFGGRASKGIDEVTSGGSAADCNGHGTHVSGTVGGSTYGIAKNVKLVAVRVLNCQGSGTTSGVIAGIDWVTANRVLPAAANMSLGGGFSSALNLAVANSVKAKVTFAVAAGNSTADACNSSPSSEPTAITVGATDNTDTFASFSNFGSCVDINAPGVNITSDWYSSNTATNTISGTSMASPHVAGAAALYLSANPDAFPADVSTALTSKATSGRLKNVPAGTMNLLLYTGFISPVAPGPPTARFTFTCNGLACSFDGSSSSAQSGASYTWDFGDGTAGNGVTASHTYASAGTYAVKLIVADGYGTSSVSQAVTVSEIVNSVARFTKSCSNRTCSFNASTSSNATSYSWNFGDGATATGVTTSHKFARNSTNTVTLTTQPGNSTAAVGVTCTNFSCK